jgi:hypothetical protein
LTVWLHSPYVALEMYSADKREFLDGEIYATACGSEEHSALASDMVRALGHVSGSAHVVCTRPICASTSRPPAGVEMPSLGAALPVDANYRNSALR